MGLRVTFLDPTVQLPAPVQNVSANPSNFSVRLSWTTILEANVSSYITHFVIYLNGTSIHRISRVKYGDGFVLHGLKPYTKYTVGIQAQDGSLKNATKVYQNFKTGEAGTSLKFICC
jgi:hypothetical protein